MTIKSSYTPYNLYHLKQLTNKTLRTETLLCKI
ncbi:hypothetical protein LCGC14_0073510 [marine sediment metagenome]|uniref:Uncharacterized protein n=1 Tax=marine sediment metagenome TaxID=412755 RepID=A0A0F9VKS2_9ZZZZ